MWSNLCSEALYGVFGNKPMIRLYVYKCQQHSHLGTLLRYADDFVILSNQAVCGKLHVRFDEGVMANRTALLCRGKVLKYKGLMVYGLSEL